MSSIGGRSGSFVVPGGLVELAQRIIPFSAIDHPHTSGTDATSASFATPITLDFVSDGSPVLIEFWNRGQTAGGAGTATSSESYVTLFLDGVFQQRLTRVQTYTDYAVMQSVKGEARLTPSAGSHTIELKQFRVNADGAIDGGGSFLRVSKIVEQGTVLKPFWTPPLVQELPSNPNVGDMVIYQADLTNGVYWQLQYDGLGAYPWKYVGGPRMEAYVAGSQATSSSTPVAIGGPTLTLPLDGHYTYGIQGNVLYAGGAVITYQRIDVGGTAVYDSWTGIDVSGYMHESGGAVNDNTGRPSGATVSHLSASPQAGTVGFYERRLWITPIMVAG